MPLFGLLYGGDLGWVGWVVPVIVILMMLSLVVRIEIAGGGERFRGPRLVFIGARIRRLPVPLLRAAPQSVPSGTDMLLLVILLAVVSDSGAYFVGTVHGPHETGPAASAPTKQSRAQSEAWSRR